MLRVAVLGRN